MSSAPQIVQRESSKTVPTHIGVKTCKKPLVNNWISRWWFIGHKIWQTADGSYLAPGSMWIKRFIASWEPLIILVIIRISIILWPLPRRSRFWRIILWLVIIPWKYFSISKIFALNDKNKINLDTRLFSWKHLLSWKHPYPFENIGFSLETKPFSN